MISNYLAIERNGQYLMDHVLIQRNDNEIMFEEVLSMSYDEIKTYDKIETFVVYIMDATNAYSKKDDDQVVVTLIDQDDIFVWSIIIGPGDVKDEFKYVFVDWRKDGKLYRYENK